MTDFMLGVNYWPRHHGIKMWTEWNADEVRAEFAQIKDMGMDTVRIFLTWNDFQPLVEKGSAFELCPIETVMRHDENITSVECPEMIDERMVAHLDEVLKVAEELELRVIVALMTAWMSGSIIDVSWRNGRNIFTDPGMLKWQMLYCQYFARRYKDNPVIAAWEFGNEQNCVMSLPSADAAWSWLRSISNQIRVEDRDAVVSSGMHGLSAHPDKNSWWGIRECADSCDLLTVHPYPPFTSGCYMDRLTDMRANMHASAQSRYYGGLGKKDVLCEETGSLGNCMLSEERTADFIRPRLYSLLANGSKGCLWWCFSDFSCGDIIPYRWVQMENDGLGLTDTLGRVKPSGREFTEFRKTLNKLPNLPPTHRKAAIVVMDTGNHWPVYYNTFILCKQAGIEAEFIYPSDSLEEYKLILCPSVKGFSPYNTRYWKRIIQSVENGATLYLSYDGSSIVNFKDTFGMKITEKLPAAGEIGRVLPSRHAPDCLKSADLHYSCAPDFQVKLGQAGARVLMHSEDNNPLLTEYSLGDGKAVFLGIPVEALLARTLYAFDNDNTYRIYQYLRDSGAAQRLIAEDPFVEKTYHPVNESEGYMVLINYRENPANLTVKAAFGKAPSHMEFIAGSSKCAPEICDGGWKIELQGLHAAVFLARWAE